MELGSSFKSLELDTDSSRGSMESLDSIASSITDEQSLEKVRKNMLGEKVSLGFASGYGKEYWKWNAFSMNYCLLRI